MIDLDQLIDRINAQLRTDEGYSENPYFCPAGKLTIGYGWNLDDCPMRRTEAEFRLENDVSECLSDMVRTFAWFCDLDTVRQAALVNLRFNLGMPRLLEFKRFLAACKERNWSQAEAELIDSRWHGQVGDRALRIERMILTGQWPI
jgi:lysozyme